MIEVCTLQRGFDLPTSQRVPGPVTLVTSSGPSDTHNEFKVRAPGVVTGRSGSIGNVFFIERDFWPLNTTLYVKDFHGNDPKFIWYLLQLFDLSRFSTGTGVPTLNRNDVHKEVVSVPQSLDEQKRIVAILDEAFEGIDRARANAEANLSDAQELFDNSLQVVFSRVRASSPAMTLSEAALSFGRGKSRHRPRNDPKLYGGNYPFVQTGEIRNSDGIVKSHSQTYNDLGLAQSKLWPAGTVCITIAANIAETAILGFPACFPDSIIGMVCNPAKSTPEYTELMLRYFSTDLKAQGKGSAQDNINLATFEQTKFPFPALAEQERTVNQLSGIAQERRNLEVHFLSVLSDLNGLRQSLLQKAFSGELT